MGQGPHPGRPIVRSRSPRAPLPRGERASERSAGEGSGDSRYPVSMSDSDQTDIARRLRRNSTPPERVMWRALRNRQLGGLKFRRQHEIGPYVADFYCAEARLVVELDGAMHEKSREHDTRRDAYIRSQGDEVIRFTVSEFTRSKDAVLSTILRIARSRIEAISPLSPAGRGQASAASAG